MKALLIDVDFATGKRPDVILDNQGKIKANLWCGHRWQNLDTGKEIRAVKDGDTTPYENKPGIIVLNTEAEIRAALVATCPDETVHTVSNQEIMSASISATTIDWAQLSQTATKEEELTFIYDKGVRGIDRRTMAPQDPLEILSA